jgi:hypothetical protein
MASSCKFLEIGEENLSIATGVMLKIMERVWRCLKEYGKHDTPG